VAAVLRIEPEKGVVILPSEFGCPWLEAGGGGEVLWIRTVVIAAGVLTGAQVICHSELFILN
jgi:hypothetical protein